MPIPEPMKQLIEFKLKEYCSKSIPEYVKDKVKMDFRIKGNNVTLLELRPEFDEPDTWIDIVVAQFRYDPKNAHWTLYCADRNSRWHEYIELKPSKKFDTLLQEVDDDPTGIFWG